MVTAYITWLLMIVAAVAGLILAAVLCSPALRHRGEVADGPDYYDTDGPVADCACEDCDDWMDIADVVSDDHAAGLLVEVPDGDHFAEDYALLNKVAPGLEGFTPLEAETLRRNYLPMTDDERFRLEMAWRSIVEGADR